MNDTIFDLAIIGGGPAGYTAAEKASKNGLNVVLFEKRALGGVCLNEGCIPTKTLLYSAKLYHNAQCGAKYGVNAENVTFDYAKMLQRKTKIVRKLAAGIRSKLQNVVVVTAEAKIENAAELITISTTNANGVQHYTAKNLLLCTGSKTFIPLIKGVENKAFITSREALELTEVPKELIVIGGGVIGMEFAGLFATLGTQVYVIEMAPEILPGIDAEIAALLRAEYEKMGVHFYLGAKVTELLDCAADIRKNIHPRTVHFTDETGDHDISADEILMSVGRRPNLDNLGLEALNLERYRSGVKVDEHMRTSVANIYAAGDITGFSMLAHTAVREAEVAVNSILGKDDTMVYNAVPGVVYTNPEVAGVGETEASAQAKNISVSVKKLPLAYSGRFVAENEGGNGLCKLIYDADKHLIGAHLIGNPASELIATATLAITQKLTTEQFEKIIFPHPSVSEIFKECNAQ